MVFKALDRLVNVEPYIAERNSEAGKRLEDKLRSKLDKSECMVAIITDKSERGVWQNQEIGYFTKMDRPIIPLREGNVQVKGFLEAREWIVIDSTRLNRVVYELMRNLRNILSITRFKIECPKCLNEFTDDIPSNNEIETYMKSRKQFRFYCPKCAESINLLPQTLAPQPRLS